MLKQCVVVVFGVLLFFSSGQAATMEQLFKQAQDAYTAERYTESATLFMEVAVLLQKNKQHDKAYAIMNNAGIASIKGNDHAKAADIYTQVVRGKGVPAAVLFKAHTNLIHCYTELGNMPQKARALENMLKAVPQMASSEKANAFAQLGDVYRHMEQYSMAVGNYAKAAPLYAEPSQSALLAKILTAQGLCQGNLGNFEAAAKSLNEARKLAQHSNEPQTLAESDSNLGILYWERGDYAQALQLLKSALDIEQAHSLVRNSGVDKNNEGLVYKSLGSFPEALNCFEEALSIARGVKNKKDEAIALANRALLYRMTGKLQEARTDYRASLALYDEIGFREGRAGVLLGIGKIAELEDRDLVLALNSYNEALNVYTDLEMPRSRAESFLQIGGILKQVVAPGRTTRDLVFDDDPVVPAFAPDEALHATAQAYAEALSIAEAVGSKEMIWAAHQGLGFVLHKQGKLEEAYGQYMKAIDLVTTMRTSLAGVALLGEYMAGKEDLYTEAMSLCADLYTKKQDNKYVEQQMRLDEVLRNEIQKASAALVQLQFADQKKQALYETLQELGRRQAKAEASVPAVATLPKEASEEVKIFHEIQSKTAKLQKVEVQKLDKTYAEKLSEWKKQYPQDAVIFESSARIDMKKIQASLKNDQLMLHYIPLQDKLMILAVSNNAIQSISVDVGIKAINKQVREDFLTGYIEAYGHGKNVNKEDEQRYYDASITLLAKWYDVFIRPVSKMLEGKKRLYIVSSGFIAQVPFAALVSSTQNAPRFLVEDFEISNIRPSFISALVNKNNKVSTKKLLAVGNPKNSRLLMKSLESAEAEIRNASAVLSTGEDSVSVTYSTEATEDWFKKNLSSNKYEYMYFATHGLPYSEIYLEYFGKGFNKNVKKVQGDIQKYKLQMDSVEKQSDEYEKLQGKIARNEQRLLRFQQEQTYLQSSLKGNSPLNGLLYLGNNASEDGLLTIREIMEAAEDVFKCTKYVFLSACNTGVTYAPKTLGDEDTEKNIESKAVEKELRTVGLTPGVDQVSFVDVFMRRNVDNVYGTLWFADDKASGLLMSKFSEILKTEPDAVKAYTAALRWYIEQCKSENVLGNGYTHTPLSPYYWAVGAIFGR